MAEIETLIDGLDFGEGPRWHDGLLWYSDFYQRAVYTVDDSGNRETVLVLDDQPSGLGWLPDGTLLVVSMTKRMIVRYDGQRVFNMNEISAVSLEGIAGENVVIDVLRDGSPMQFSIPRGPLGVAGGRRRR